MEKKENQRVALTKRLLKEALLKLMERKSIQKISVSELCQTAGINRSTFYNHYGSQFDVLREMEMDMVRDLEEMWEGLYTTDSSTISRRAEMLCTYIMENKELTKLVFSNSETTSEFAVLLFGSGRLKSIYDIIFSDEPDIYKKELMKTYYSCGAYHMLRQWILDDFPVSPKELGDIICSMANIYSDTSRKNTAGE